MIQNNFTITPKALPTGAASVPLRQVDALKPQFSASVIKRIGTSTSHNLAKVFDKVDSDYLWGFLALDVVAMWVPRFVVGLTRGRYEYDPTSDPSNTGISPWQQMSKSIHKNLAGLNYANLAEEAIREIFTAPGVLLLPTLIFLVAYASQKNKSSWLSYSSLGKLSGTFNHHLNEIDNELKGKAFNYNDANHRDLYNKKVKTFFTNLFATKNVSFKSGDKITIDLEAIEKQLKDKNKDKNFTKDWLLKEFASQERNKGQNYKLPKSLSKVTFDDPTKFMKALIDRAGELYAEKSLSLLKPKKLTNSGKISKQALKDTNKKLSTILDDFEYLLTHTINNEQVKVDGRKALKNVSKFDIQYYRSITDGKGQLKIQPAELEKTKVSDLMNNLHKFKDNIVKIITEQKKHAFGKNLPELGQNIFKRTRFNKVALMATSTVLGCLYLYYLPRISQNHEGYPANRLLDEKMKDLEAKKQKLKTLNTANPFVNRALPTNTQPPITQPVLAQTAAVGPQPLMEVSA